MSALGLWLVSAAAELGALLVRAGHTVRALATRGIEAREVVRQTHRFFFDVLPLAALASVVVGGVVAMQGLGYLRRYDATLVFGWAAGLSAFRDVGPLLLAFCLSARAGSKNAAELASMAARERFDALRALGLDPERVVIIPRLLALTAVAALLYVPMCALVLMTSFAFALLLGGQRPAVSLWSFLDYCEPAILYEGCARLVVFGALIGLASCHAGRALEDHGHRSARAIGGAVFSSSVLTVVTMVVTNLILSVAGGTS